MLLARVSGSVVSSVKVDGIDGSRYLIVKPCSPSGVTGTDGIVALDPLGAGTGEMVLVSQGSSTRQSRISKDKPIDALIIGIVDTVEESDKVVFQK